MSRNILMLAPALAFALPFVTSQPTMARPLATQAPETLWDDRDGDRDDDDSDDDDDGGGDEFIALQVCFEAQLVLAQEDRSYSCDLVEGPQCLSNCTAEAVAPLCQSEIASRARGGDFATCVDERLATCRSQCETGGAAFCHADNDLKARDGDHDDDDNDHHEDDDDDDDDIAENIDIHEEDGFIFIDVEICLDLVIESDDI
ncbi:hypothetical protein SAMN02745121_05402 [Nannocystis exedens]|uniref:Uncharacterized protein n=1 Tax=Nannocystis exedens TaxID=54 RepID=A0A1I2D5U8_9BACT|nr:hypothetical protein [Nannocystis exedens]PCC70713.1 hypothetical protein NAEX_03777 [Nannocystis exedens]SFE75906.1 hypothetical protein SAMN02745121_05402 [Nannocystis exedens]